MKPTPAEMLNVVLCPPQHGAEHCQHGTREPPQHSSHISLPGLCGCGCSGRLSRMTYPNNEQGKYDAAKDFLGRVAGACAGKGWTAKHVDGHVLRVQHPNKGRKAGKKLGQVEVVYSPPLVGDSGWATRWFWDDESRAADMAQRVFLLWYFPEGGWLLEDGSDAVQQVVKEIEDRFNNPGPNLP